MPRKYDPVHIDLFSDADVKRVSDACAEFRRAADVNEAAIRSAEHAVAMTLSWVGAGKELLAVAKTVIEKELAKPGEPEEKKDRLAGLQGKIGEMTAIADTLRGLLPPGMG